MPPSNCPLCSTEIRLVQINLSEATYMCPNTKCIYPLGVPNLQLEYIQRDYTEISFQKKPNDTSSRSTFQDPTPLAKEVENDNMNDMNLDQLFNDVDSLNVNPVDIDEFESLFDSLLNSDRNNT